MKYKNERGISYIKQSDLSLLDQQDYILMGYFEGKEKKLGETVQRETGTQDEEIEQSRTSYSNCDLKGSREDLSKFFTFFSCLYQRLF